MEGLLYLEDGTVYEGDGFGAKKTMVGELVFNTSMTGYQEILTDPSYAGQIINLTYPLVGNYGITDIDNESGKIHAFGLVAKQISDMPSNALCVKTIHQWLLEQDVPGVCGVDTRAITKKVRQSATVKCVISTESITPAQAKALCSETQLRNDWMKVSGSPVPLHFEPSSELETGFNLAADAKLTKDTNLMPTKLAKDANLTPTAKPTKDANLTPTAKLASDANSTEDVNPTSATNLPDVSSGRTPLKVAVLDLGTKSNILKSLTDRGCEVFLFPYGTSAKELLSVHPDGICLTNGPGDPAEATEAIEEIRALLGLESPEAPEVSSMPSGTPSLSIPMMGICMGHQLIALALGGKTFKLLYGHRGGNHGVSDRILGRCYITSQNHGYAVSEESVQAVGMEITHVNLNDGTVEGMRHPTLPLFSVQFHPESCPGPQDSGHLFDLFLQMMEEHRTADPTGEEKDSRLADHSENGTERQSAAQSRDGKEENQNA